MTFPLEAFTTVSAANPWTYVVFAGIGFAFGYTWKWRGSAIPENSRRSSTSRN